MKMPEMNLNEDLIIKALTAKPTTFHQMMNGTIKCHITCGNLMTIVSLLTMICGDGKEDVELRDKMGIRLEEIAELIVELNDEIMEHIERSLN